MNAFTLIDITTTHKVHLHKYEIKTALMDDILGNRHRTIFCWIKKNI